MKKGNLSGNLPVKQDLKVYYALSLVILLLSTFASVYGILHSKEVYPSGALISTFYPNDVVNLVLGGPLLAVSLLLTWRGKWIGLLCWPGAVFFIFYSYFPYLVSVPFGPLFLPHIVLFSLSIYTTIGIAASIDTTAVTGKVSRHVPPRISGGILMGLSLLILIRQIVMIIGALSGKSAVTALDLSVWVDDFTILPAFFVGGLMLWKKRSLGYVSGAGLFLMYAALSVALVPFLIIQSGMKNIPFDIGSIFVVAIMAAICLIPFAFFVRGTGKPK